MTIKHIFVVGAGAMGNGIAQTAAVSGYQVTMMDVVPEQLERARAFVASSWGAARCCPSSTWMTWPD